MSEPSTDDYTVGWICALQEEYEAACRMLDLEFDGPETSDINAPPEALLGVIPEMRRRHNDPRTPDRFPEHLRLMDDILEYRRPSEDRLYNADYEHKGGKSCIDCDVDELIERPPRKSRRAFMIHYGIIASANSVMGDVKERDRYAHDPEMNVLCFETEAGGLMNNFPCLVIRGICSYSDSHRNGEWHNYAALTAAAYARELLLVLKPQKITRPLVQENKLISE
ncbi:hypothetical protein PT974_03232 [Cladobotryum mycophilum]|uniref:Nucleoside phosphorylase domain-containing protein n=1 Tax=Cladobotryum mycophilum TaxID=491253 RepID=A0ABR0SST6_9HYPO